MAYYFLILYGIYFLMLLVLLAGWLVATQQPREQQSTVHSFSVIIPFRNEEAHLPGLLESFKLLDYPTTNFELIFVNDHSTDDSLNLIEKWKSKFHSSAITVSLKNEMGKKQALMAGISSARHEWVLTTDADVIISPIWLQEINRSIQPHSQLLLGTVQIKATHFWSQLQQLEFFSVMAVTLSSWGWRKPILCNGANLAFRREAFEAVKGYEGNLHLASGDDEFLLKKIVDRFGASSIGYHGATVLTMPQPTIKDFFHQRLRWASKWRLRITYSSLLALLVFWAQLSWWPLLLSSFVFQFPYLEFLIGSKLLIEFFILYSVSVFFNQKFRWRAFFVLQLIYAPYVVLVALFSRSGYGRWKDRPLVSPG